MRQVGASNDLQLPRGAGIDRGEVLLPAFMGEPQNAAPVLRKLHRHAFAHAAKPLERIVPEQFEIPGQRAVRLAAFGHSVSPQRWFWRNRSRADPLKSMRTRIPPDI